MPNPYRAFLSLLPAQALERAECVSAEAASRTCIVRDATGRSWRVRGAADVGQTVLVRGDAIEGIAPALSAVSIEI